jgi:hypothetical protein
VLDVATPENTLTMAVPAVLGSTLLLVHDSECRREGHQRAVLDQSADRFRHYGGDDRLSIERDDLITGQDDGCCLGLGQQRETLTALSHAHGEHNEPYGPC